MNVRELIKKLGDFDDDLRVRLGADGAVLGEALSVYTRKADGSWESYDSVIIAEWESK